MQTRAILWLAVALALVTPAVACSGGDPSGGTTVNLVVCARSENWVRPSVEQERAEIWSLPRHQGKDEARLREVLEETQVFVWLGGNSELGDRSALTGIWTADDLQTLGDCGEPNDASRGVWEHLYLLNYRAVDLDILSSTFELTVEPTDRGYEHVAFRNPLYRQEKVPVPYQVRVVAPDGEELYERGSCVPRDKVSSCPQPTEESVSSGVR